MLSIWGQFHHGLEPDAPIQRNATFFPYKGLVTLEAHWQA